MGSKNFLGGIRKVPDLRVLRDALRGRFGYLPRNDSTEVDIKYEKIEKELHQIPVEIKRAEYEKDLHAFRRITN